ncbi:MAG: sulfatase [Sandaracinaceae bacterium]
MRRGSLLLCIVLVGCSAAAADPPGVPAAAPSDAVPQGRARVRFDLARHLERAEQRFGSTRFVDFGGPGGAAVTAGGWLSHVGHDRVEDETTVALTTRSRARIAVPPVAETTEIALRLRAYRPGTVRLYLEEREVHSQEVERGAWTVVTATLPAGEAERELIVRFDRGSRIDGQRAYLALDWLSVGDARPPESRIEARSVDGVPALTVPEGWGATYPFEVMPGARLRGVVRGTLEVWVRSGDTRTRVATIPPGDTASQLDVSLAPFENQLAWLELRAPSGDVELFRPAVVTEDGAPPISMRRPRNVVLYLIDTLRADRLEAYDADTRVRAPGLSRFARGASTFLGARSQENWTKPSVATLLSSLLPWEHTAFADASRVPSTVRLMPQHLHDEGFTTAGFVANGYVSNRFGFRRGWDTWRNYIREGRSTRGEALARDVLSWLDERPEEPPFFLYVHAIDPHVPYRPPSHWVEEYDPGPYHGPVDFSRNATLLERIKTGGLRLGARDRRRLEALYDGEVSYQDTHLSAILDGLESRGLADDTMVIITADHGEELYDHGSVGHGHSLYDELVHVPLLIRLPGLPPAQIQGSVGLVDVLPTVLDALGHTVPDSLSGRSLLPMLRGESESAPPVSVAGFMGNWRSVVSGRYKLLARSRGRYQVYDLIDDPDEQQNLAASRPELVAYLRGLMGVSLAHSPAAITPGRRVRRAPTHRASEATIDAELEAQLRALGYVGASRPE